MNVNDLMNYWLSNEENSTPQSSSQGCRGRQNANTLTSQYHINEVDYLNTGSREVKLLLIFYNNNNEIWLKLQKGSLYSHIQLFDFKDM